MTVWSESIGGRLNYVDDYSSAYGPGEDSGHYLVVHAEVPDEENAVITGEVIGGDHGPTTLDADGIIIFRIKNNTQKIKFIAYVDDEVVATRVFTINGLILA